MGVITGGVIITGAIGRAQFISAEQTGTAAPQNVAHGLGVVPRAVLVALTGHGTVAVDVAEGTHTATDVVVTVTNAVTFKVVAWT